jgi:tRNA pseudouridine38-40 synthase
MTHHIVLQIAYDGSSYLGWQKTKEGLSIEATLEEVLSKIFSEKILIRAASRTDRGVHAEGQVVDFFCEKLPKSLDKVFVSLNQLLPPDIRCLNIDYAPYLAFHPSLSSTKKRYRYKISHTEVQLPCLRNTHWHVRNPLNVSLMQEGASLLIGTHDFRGLCNRRADLHEEDTVRTVYAIDIFENADELILDVTGNNFLYKMVRNIVGTLTWIGVGKIDLSAINKALHSRKRCMAGVTAPAHGLTLLNIEYTHLN